MADSCVPVNAAAPSPTEGDSTSSGWKEFGLVFASVAILLHLVFAPALLIDYLVSDDTHSLYPKHPLEFYLTMETAFRWGRPCFQFGNWLMNRCCRSFRHAALFRSVSILVLSLAAAAAAGRLKPLVKGDRAALVCLLTALFLLPSFAFYITAAHALPVSLAVLEAILAAVLVTSDAPSTLRRRWLRVGGACFLLLISLATYQPAPTCFFLVLIPPVLAGRFRMAARAFAVFAVAAVTYLVILRLASALLVVPNGQLPMYDATAVHLSVWKRLSAVRSVVLPSAAQLWFVGSAWMPHLVGGTLLSGGVLALTFGRNIHGTWARVVVAAVGTVVLVGAASAHYFVVPHFYHALRTMPGPSAVVLVFFLLAAFQLAERGFPRVFLARRAVAVAACCVAMIATASTVTRHVVLPSHDELVALRNSLRSVPEGEKIDRVVVRTQHARVTPRREFGQTLFTAMHHTQFSIPVYLVRREVTRKHVAIPPVTVTASYAEDEPVPARAPGTLLIDLTTIQRH